MAKAYGSLTITDLLDTATYIYYAKDATGAGASTTPSATLKYIGIYSGESLGEQPASPPSGTKWYKYLGDDGKDGEDGQDGKDGKDGTNGISVDSITEYYTLSRTPLSPPSILDLTKYFKVGQKYNNSEITSLTENSITIKCVNAGAYYFFAIDLTPILTPGKTYTVTATKSGTHAAMNIDESPDGSFNDRTQVSVSSITPIEGYHYRLKIYMNASGTASTLTYTNTYTNIALQESWSTTPPTPTNDLPYVWSYSEIKYSNNTTDKTEPRIIGVYGDKGDPGDKGDKGDNAYVYRVETNQEEILKFKQENSETVTYSPQILIFSVNSQTEGIVTELSTSEYGLELDICNTDNGDWLDLSFILTNTSYFYKDSTNKKWNFAIFKLVNQSLEGESEQEDYNQLISILKNQETVLRIKIKDSTTNNVIALYPVHVRFGTTNEMATFALHAGGITAAIQNSKLDFDANGLTVTNGGITVKKETENVFYVDTSGNLVMKGIVEAESGKFHGTIVATDGKFHGDIDATSGKLGNLEITGTLTLGSNIKIDGNSNIGIYTNGYVEGGSSGFYISDNGTIYANAINLGESATISKYIRLGNSWIINPSSPGIYDYLNSETDGKESEQITLNTFITVKDSNKNDLILLTADGYLKIGNSASQIVIDGSHGEISQNYEKGRYTGWQINSEEAIFNNIVARGSIKASVLEYGEVQAVGGILIVRPSSIIKTATQNSSGEWIVTLENKTGFSSGDYCIISFNDANSKHYKIEVSDENIRLIGTSTSTVPSGQTLVGCPLIDMGQTSSIGVGINSSTNNALVAANAISIFQANITDSTMYLQPKIILGKIPNESIYGRLKGDYGLYADNVLLNGAMISRANNKTAGINTASNARETDNNFGTKGNIVLWAGADGDTDNAIQDAKFRVDTEGNIFAGSGYFKGTIITDATISAAELQTAVITGINSAKDAALIIKDTNEGILFKDSNGQTCLNVTNTSMDVGVNLNIGTKTRVKMNDYFVSPKAFYCNSDSDIDGIGNGIIIEPNEISFSTSGWQFNNDNAIYQASLNYDKGFNIKISGNTITNFTSNLVSVGKDISLANNVYYGTKVEYKPAYTGSTLVGYDIFVNE